MQLLAASAGRQRLIRDRLHGDNDRCTEDDWALLGESQKGGLHGFLLKKNPSRVCQPS